MRGYDDCLSFENMTWVSFQFLTAKELYSFHDKFCLLLSVNVVMHGSCILVFHLGEFLLQFQFWRC